MKQISGLEQLALRYHNNRSEEIARDLRLRYNYISVKNFVSYPDGEMDVLGLRHTKRGIRLTYFEIKSNSSRKNRKKALKQAKRFYDFFSDKYCAFILVTPHGYQRVKRSEV